MVIIEQRQRLAIACREVQNHLAPLLGQEVEVQTILERVILSVQAVGLALKDSGMDRHEEYSTCVDCLNIGSACTCER